MRITGTHFSYYLVCHRKLWLFSHDITLEHTSDIVADGRLLHESSYPQRSSKYEEISIEGIKIDYYDVKNKVIHEIKRSPKIEESHIWQVKYYIYIFEQKGLKDVKGRIEYPLLHKTIDVFYTEDDKKTIELMCKEIMKISSNDICPDVNKKSFCRNCSYFDFCFVSELEE